MFWPSMLIFPGRHDLLQLGCPNCLDCNCDCAVGSDCDCAVEIYALFKRRVINLFALRLCARMFIEFVVSVVVGPYKSL